MTIELLAFSQNSPEQVIDVSEERLRTGDASRPASIRIPGVSTSTSPSRVGIQTGGGETPSIHPSIPVGQRESRAETRPSSTEVAVPLGDVFPQLVDASPQLADLERLRQDDLFLFVPALALLRRRVQGCAETSQVTTRMEDNQTRRDPVLKIGSHF